MNSPEVRAEQEFKPELYAYRHLLRMVIEIAESSVEHKADHIPGLCCCAQTRKLLERLDEQAEEDCR